jgi:periplasmic copper chaperone A
MTSSAFARSNTAPSPRPFRTVWRWYFYAGLHVASFMFTQVLSGLVMKLRTTKLAQELSLALGLCFAALFNIGTSRADDMKLGDIIIHHPWSAEAPKVAPVIAGYVDITNTGQEDDTLIAATAAISGKAQFHEMKMTGDVMKMSELKNGILIPTGKTVKIEPMGGLHIMFAALTTHPKKGDHFKGTLVFQKAGTMNVEFEVEKEMP